MERNASNLLQDLERDDIEGHLLELTSATYMKEHLMNNHGILSWYLLKFMDWTHVHDKK